MCLRDSDEFEHQLIQGLEDENIMRGLVHKITTSSGDRKIPLVTARGSASWIEEEAAIPESDDTFGQVTLGAHKVGCMIRVSEELLHDSAFDPVSYTHLDVYKRQALFLCGMNPKASSRSYRFCIC